MASYVQFICVCTAPLEVILDEFYLLVVYDSVNAAEPEVNTSMLCFSSIMISDA